MADQPPAFHLRSARDQATLDRLPAWTDRVVAGLGLAGRPAYALRLCLEEAVANLVMHGQPRDAVACDEIDLHAELSDAACILTITDRCVPFDPWSAEASPRPMTTQLPSDRIGGAGLILLRHFADAVHYHAEAGLNRLVIHLSRGDH